MYILSNPRITAILKPVINSSPVWLSLIVLMLGVFVQYHPPAFLKVLSDLTFDGYQNIRPRPFMQPSVRVVTIDNKSLNEIGPWPWPKDKMAMLVEKLTGMGAKVIAFNMVFDKADPSASEKLLQLRELASAADLMKLATGLENQDEIFAEAVSEGPVVTGFQVENKKSSAFLGKRPASFLFDGQPQMPDVSLPLDTFGATGTLQLISREAKGNGGILALEEQEVIARSFPLLFKIGRTIHPSLVLETLRVAQGADTIDVKIRQPGMIESWITSPGIAGIKVGNLDIPTDTRGNILFYYDSKEPKRFISAADILHDKVPAPYIEGHTVIIGMSASGLLTSRFSPFGNAIPEVEIQAQLAEQIINSNYLLRPHWEPTATASMLIVSWLIMVFFPKRLRSILMGWFVIGVAFWFYLASFWLFMEQSILVDPILPLIGLLSIFLAISIPRNLAKEMENRWIRDAFSRYVSPNRVKHLLENPDKLRLEAEFQECTFVLTDLAGFTSLMENYEPNVVVSILNEYLDHMVKIAFKHDGTLDRIVGDAVAVMFSAPIEQADHAERGLACAMEMDEFAQKFAKTKQDEGFPFGKTRVGVNTGKVLVGNFGGTTMFDYRALGDPINTCARLESVNKQLGGHICVSWETVQQCPDFVGREVGTLVLKGKAQGIKAFEPLSREEEQSERVVAYKAAFELMKSEDPKAVQMFAELAKTYPEDPLIKFHNKRLGDGQSGERVVFTQK
ncbi:MAG: adenylate/guanylate cyclase domain-containing protein [Magnetococcales bacterium]|nr:adenylate/guanylate cyclase domain-containing protein [Magnetococcales bacterium]